LPRKHRQDFYCRKGKISFFQLRFFRWAFLFLLLCGAAGCRENSPWRLRDISGHLPDLRFALTADNGRSANEADFRGEVVLLYFGFTGCSSQCPVTMARLARALASLGPDAARVRVLFVTLDPAHDGPAALRAYAAAFDPRHITGLTGPARRIARLARRYRVAFGGGAHGNAVFIFGKDGKARLLLTPQDTDEALLHDLRRMARS
jgi:protein SCO1/2